MALQTITVYDVMLQAYRYAGVVHAPMRGLSGPEQQEGLNMLNAMINAYRADRAWIPTQARYVFPINANQQSYVIGQDTSGGIPDWQIDRPEVIQRAGFLYSGQTNPVIEVEFQILNEQQWDALSPKTLVSTVPYMLWYQSWTGAGQNGIVWLWPIPTNSWEIALYLWVNLEEVTGPDQVLQIPPAYNDALSYGLAVRLAAVYPRLLNPLALAEIKQQAAAAKQRIRTINFPALISQCELSSMGTRERDNYGAHYSPISNQYT